MFWQGILSRYAILRYIGNRYVLVFVFFMVWMLFLDNYSYLEHRMLDRDIDELEDNIRYYREQIHHDETQIKKLKNLDQVEKYAREKYFMKRENEDIYLIEFEADSLTESNSPSNQ
jgi:cell division protein FtsB